VLKGKRRLDGRKTTNPVAVGDVVDVESDENGDYVIANIHPRKNYIIRKSINLSKQAQILASNLDQAMLVVTLVAPRTSLGLIDRYLIT
ncbi:MAG TPA: ribosome small subunit-dependent GTPase A, partial [Bacteroidia bacterium]|nr:ribosome small subunit-dependent GTPase A [Bacteroidia bacterium]